MVAEILDQVNAKVQAHGLSAVHFSTCQYYGESELDESIENCLADMTWWAVVRHSEYSTEYRYCDAHLDEAMLHWRADPEALDIELRRLTAERLAEWVDQLVTAL